jgi:hypothetical protein
LENLIRFSVNEAGTSRASGEAMLAKLSEALFVETLRSYTAQLPSGQTGWLAGARDSEVGQTLALMHRNPTHAWTVATLAKKAGISGRSNGSFKFLPLAFAANRVCADLSL